MFKPRLTHHIQLDVCTSRAKYRQGRKFLAVKVYTTSSESPHLLIFGVPSLGLRDELRRLCVRYGDVLAIAPVVPGYEGEESFTETFHVQYKRAVSARFSKKHLDGRNFFGGILHVCYAPEFETLAETRAKLNQRRIDVGKRTTCNSGSSLMLTERRHRNFLNTEQNICTSTNDQTSHNSNCIWKGNVCKSDPRTTLSVLRPAPNIVQSFGPQLPDEEWVQAGVRERKLLAVLPQALKPATCIPRIPSSKPDIVSSGTSSHKFLPRQISINRIVFLKKQNSLNNLVDGVMENKTEVCETYKRKADHLDNADIIVKKSSTIIDKREDYSESNGSNELN